MSATQATPRPSTCQQFYVVALPVALGVEDDIELPSPGLLSLRGGDVEVIRRAMRLPHRIAIIDESPLAEAPAAVLAARQAAIDLARDQRGVVIDMFVPQIVSTHGPALSLEASAQWFVFGYEGDETVTYGLERFGLPEIRTTDTSPRSMVDAVVVGLAHRIITRWPADDPLGVHEVTLSDISRGYGQPPEHADERQIRVGVELSAERDFLNVTLLDDPETHLFQA